MVKKVSTTWLPLTLIALSTFLSLSHPAAADPSPRSRNEFCLRSGTLDNFKQIAADDDNRLSFKNAGGIFGGGVCWWHSRFQRSATYLSVFRPDLSKPTLSQVKDIIHAIRWNESVVEIPGYENMHDFSADFQDLIQKELNRWQADDGTIGFGWIDGLAGQSKYLDPALLKQSMDDLYNLVVVQKEIVFEKLQLPGISAHAWLVIDMIPEGSDYQLKVIDSNYPDETKTIDYHMGDTHVTMDYTGWTFIPYVDQKRDLPAIQASLQSYCQH